MRKRRLICLLLSLVLLVGCLPMQAMAAESHPNTYINTGSNRMDLLGVARTQVGYMEGANNNTKYGQWYGMNWQPWCAMFISWCARSAGISNYLLKNSALATPDYSGFNIPYVDGANYTPKLGDLFFKKNFEHTGIVYHVDGEYFYTIEGNTNNDGSDNGNRVLCAKRKISDYYFGTPRYVEPDPMPAPVVSTEKKQYECGQSVTVTWEKVAYAVSYEIIVYYNGDIVHQKNVGKSTSFVVPSVEIGNYLVSVSAKFSDGKEGFAQHGFDVVAAPMLTVKYNANGGTITPDSVYMVSNGSGTYFRSSYMAGATNLAWLSTGTQLAIDELVYYGGYWGHGYYNGNAGWFSLEQCQRAGYGLDDRSDIMQYPRQNKLTTWWYARVGDAKKLLDPQSVGLVREYYNFMGWSTKADGSEPVLGSDGSAVTAAEVAPKFGKRDMTVTLYAVWEKIIESISIESLPYKTQYYAEEALDTSGLKIKVKYADGTKATLTEGFTVTGFDPSRTGKQKVKVSIGDKEVTFEVTVDARLKYVVEDGTVSITDYKQGDGGIVIIPATIGGKKVTKIAKNAFKDCDKITSVVIPDSVTSIGKNAFYGCSALTNVNFTGSKTKWNAISISSGNDALKAATRTYNYKVLGDYTGDMKVDNNDVIYLLWHSLFPSQFPVNMTADLNADGKVNNDDVITLLWHSLFPDNFPLVAAMSVDAEELEITESDTHYDAMNAGTVDEEVADQTEELPAEEENQEEILPPEEQNGEAVTPPAEENRDEAVTPPAEDSAEPDVPPAAEDDNETDVPPTEEESVEPVTPPVEEENSEPVSTPETEIDGEPAVEEIVE